MKQKDILIILILLFLFVIIWIGSSIYRNSIKSTISETINKDISPIDPTFDIKAIDKLRERKNINPSFELESITPTPTPLPPEFFAPISSEEGKLLL